MGIRSLHPEVMFRRTCQRHKGIEEQSVFKNDYKSGVVEEGEGDSGDR